MPIFWLLLTCIIRNPASSTSLIAAVAIDGNELKATKKREKQH